MLIDFENVHRTYLVGWSQGGKWQFTPTNDQEPRKGFYPSSHQVFSNHALQIALSVYNAVDEVGCCVGVRHCLYLLFSRKERGSYLLGNDPCRIAFHLDIGVCGDLYGLAVGHSDRVEYRVVRTGKSPKSFAAVATHRDGRRVVVIRATHSNAGQATTIEVELDRAALIALAAHCIAYGRLLYPSLSDAAVQGLLSSPSPYFRACAEIQASAIHDHGGAEPASGGVDGSSLQNPSQPTRPVAQPVSPELGRLHKTIWAIGNQKWPNMKLPALQAIQKLDNLDQLRRLIDAGNAGDFREWDGFLC